jgi:tRNA-splicing ligase RtcB (3'-phosphate/5'-hydroxy nucleic acid ligase)
MKERSAPITATAASPDAPVILPANGRRRVPVHLFVSPEIMPGRDALDELEALAATAGLAHPIVAMPDVHFKGRNPAPTGIVLATRDHLVPFAIDKGINCGMRMVQSDLPASACTGRMLDALYTELQRHIPIQPHHEAVLRKKDVRRALSEGARWACEHFELPDAERDAIERRGSMFEDRDIDPDAILATLPDVAIKKARRAFGTLGAGNHFLEAQEIVEILDAEKAARLGLEKGRVLFMMHTGSGAVGGLAMRYYSTHGRLESRRERLAFDFDKLRFHLRHARFAWQDALQIWNYLAAHRQFFTIPADSHQGRRFIDALYAASNFGFVNRMAITEALRNAVRTTFAAPELKLPLLFDCSHVTIQQEEHAGERVWVHRHGANVALPPSRCAGHPVFASTGQPIPIPGSMGSDSYIGVGVEGNAATYCSANHGAGRVLDKPQAMAQFSARSVEAEMAARHIRLYRGGTMDIAEQAPGSFKDIRAVVDVMQRLSIAQPVVRVRPLATLKG